MIEILCETYGKIAYRDPLLGKLWLMEQLNPSPSLKKPEVKKSPGFYREGFTVTKETKGYVSDEEYEHFGKIVYLDLNEVEVYGWENDRSKELIDLLTKGIEHNDQFPPVFLRRESLKEDMKSRAIWIH